ncbi:MAG: DUF1223 domain-containing protein [Dichotomicrobium sp.]
MTGIEVTPGGVCAMIHADGGLGRPTLRGSNAMNARRFYAFPGFLAGLMAVVALAMSPSARVFAEDGPEAASGPVVVELFTSQSCSSCPPADRLLGKLAERPDVIAMSLPVDYWDHLQWEDTLGRSEHSERQRIYARQLGLANVYTPQMVVNGIKNVIGSHSEAVEQAIRAARKSASPVPVRLEMEGDGFTVRLGPAKPGAAATEAAVLVVPLLSARTVDIKRGENRGKTITYHNVSREIRQVGTWRGEETALTLTHDEVMTGDADRCAVILQDTHSGAILGAALLEDA